MRTFRFLPFFLSLTLFVPARASAEAVDTIATHETERYFYKDGHMMKLDNQFEMTYLLDLEKNVLTRTRVYDFLNKKITPDETAYHMERQLLSHPTNADRYILDPVVRAIGQTSADALEMILIQDKFVETITSSGDEIVISRARRIR